MGRWWLLVTKIMSKWAEMIVRSPFDSTSDAIPSSAGAILAALTGGLKVEAVSFTL